MCMGPYPEVYQLIWKGRILFTVILPLKRYDAVKVLCFWQISLHFFLTWPNLILCSPYNPIADVMQYWVQCVPVSTHTEMEHWYLFISIDCHRFINHVMIGISTLCNDLVQLNIRCTEGFLCKWWVFRRVTADLYLDPDTRMKYRQKHSTVITLVKLWTST